MKSNRKHARILEDVKISVKIKLSALWAVMMFLYIYADYQTLLQPGLLEQIIAGEVGGTRFTQAVLFGGAIFVSIPSIMIFLSLALKPKVNRLANIILGSVYIVAVIANLLTLEEIWAYFVFYTVAEIFLNLLIIRYAWRWPEKVAYS